MPNRIAKFVPAIFTCVLASTPVSYVSHAAAPADNCLASPNGQSPEGSHWYYRVDRATRRHCWYLGEERPTATRAVQSNWRAMRGRRSHDVDATMQSIADARTEIARQRQIEKSSQSEAPRAALEAPNPVPSERSVFASRWPGQSSAVSPTEAVSSNSNGEGTVDSISQTKQPVPAAVQLATADISADILPYSNASNDPKPLTYSMPMRLAAVIGALLLASIIASTVFRVSSMRQSKLAKVRERRRVNWERVNMDRTAYPVAGAWPRGQLHQTSDPNVRIATFIAQLRRLS